MIVSSTVASPDPRHRWPPPPNGRYASGAGRSSACLDGLLLDQISAPHDDLADHAGHLVTAAGFAGRFLAVGAPLEPPPDRPSENGAPTHPSEAPMAELSSTKRDQLKDSDFAYVDADRKGHLPIHDASHVRNAAARFDQTKFASADAKKKAAKAIIAAAKKHDIELADDDAVVQAAG